MSTAQHKESNEKLKHIDEIYLNCIRNIESTKEEIFYLETLDETYTEITEAIRINPDIKDTMKEKRESLQQVNLQDKKNLNTEDNNNPDREFINSEHKEEVLQNLEVYKHKVREAYGDNFETEEEFEAFYKNIVDNAYKIVYKEIKYVKKNQKDSPFIDRENRYTNRLLNKTKEWITLNDKEEKNNINSTELLTLSKIQKSIAISNSMRILRQEEIYIIENPEIKKQKLEEYENIRRILIKQNEEYLLNIFDQNIITQKQKGNPFLETYGDIEFIEKLKYIDNTTDTYAGALLYGPPGTGKTAVLENYAKENLKKKATVISCTQQTNANTLIGENAIPLDFDNATQEEEDKRRITKFIEGAIVNAMREGKVIILDETDKMPQWAWDSLSYLLSKKKTEKEFQLPNGEIVTIEEGFRIYATSNSTEELPEYVKDRFNNGLLKKETPSEDEIIQKSVYWLKEGTGEISIDTRELNKLYIFFKYVMPQINSKNEINSISMRGVQSIINRVKQGEKIESILTEIIAGNQENNQGIRKIFANIINIYNEINNHPTEETSLLEIEAANTYLGLEESTVIDLDDETLKIAADKMMRMSTKQIRTETEDIQDSKLEKKTINFKNFSISQNKENNTLSIFISDCGNIEIEVGENFSIEDCSDNGEYVLIKTDQGFKKVSLIQGLDENLINRVEKEKISISARGIATVAENKSIQFTPHKGQEKINYFFSEKDLKGGNPIQIKNVEHKGNKILVETDQGLFLGTIPNEGESVIFNDKTLIKIDEKTDKVKINQDGIILIDDKKLIT